METFAERFAYFAIALLAFLALIAGCVGAAAWVASGTHHPSHEGCQALTGSDSRGDTVTVYLCPTPEATP